MTRPRPAAPPPPRAPRPADQPARPRSRPPSSPDGGRLHVCDHRPTRLGKRSRPAGAVRADVDADDVMRLIFAATAGAYVDDAQRERAVRIILDGIHPQAAGQAHEHG
ncbi:hypothetical protein [Streptomyces sp. TS71-3]|uniref:SbtR family transcriptional regulator n=1 Tax=Streptomyces sp. TS71-3 TaxID=2733862 RepID=UPI0035ABF1BF